MDVPNRITLNISEEWKSFLWTPPKTGSMHAITIFSCLPFQSFECSYDRKTTYRYSDFPVHGHHITLFEGHENYKLICTARNPLHRLISAYQFSSRTKELSPKDFRKFFFEQSNKDSFSYYLMGLHHLPRIPDYFIRLEKMYEDYMKIPFISETQFAKCGVLLEICNRKKNQSTSQLNPEECYTSDMIDFIYTKYKWYFDKLDYEPIL